MREGLVGECLLVNGLCGSRRRICRNPLVSIYIEVFMHHFGVCVCSFLRNPSNFVRSVPTNH